jgi:non-haem Fe2+, alpha-ketoglutarate-dependent halogenase
MLDESQKQQYAQMGFTWPMTVLTPHAAAAYRTRFEEYERAQGGWYELSKGQKLYLLQTWVAELVSHASVLDAVADVLGPNIMCWGTSLFVKEARSTSFVTWHQDSTYWGLSSADVVSAWIALSPATLEAGCMKMVPGGASRAQIQHKDTLAAENLLTRGQEIMMDVDESQAHFAVLQPGQMSLHNIRTVHASEPNLSDDRRIGLAVRYIKPNVRQQNAPQDSAWLLRGVDEHNNFIHETPPYADMDAAAVAEHERILALRQGVLYQGVAGKPAHTELLTKP